MMKKAYIEKTSKQEDTNEGKYCQKRKRFRYDHYFV